ncbi:MAG: HU family DNA-binding protein [Alphaproteobacteria bacterium]
MNKSELITSIASKTGLTKTDSTKALDAFIASVAEEVKKGGEVRLVGFGTFGVSERKATTGRNPRTGATIKIAAKKVVKFKAGSELVAIANSK